MRPLISFIAITLTLCALMSMPAYAACPAPSGAGYTCQDSLTDGVPYAFEDISSTGAALGLPDDRSAIIPIGFTFDYFGTGYTHVSVSDNGHMDFAYGWGNESPNDSNLTVPQPSNLDPFSSSGWGVNPLIAVWFDDLDPYVDGGIFYEVRGVAPDRKLIVQWDKMKHFNCASTDTLTFQAILFESTGSILMQYEDAVVTTGCSLSASQGASATVGLDLDGSAGLQYSANAANITNSFAVLFEQGAAPVITSSAGSVDFGIVNTGGSDSRAIMLRNTGGSLLFFSSIGGLSGEFSLADACSGSYLQPGQSCALGVSFSPTIDATGLSNTLSITSNATVNPLDITLTGDAATVSTQDITVVNPASMVYDFGSVNVGSTSTISVIVSNDGTSDLAMTGIGFNNTPTGAFSFTSADCNSTITAGNTCFRNLRFAPTAGGVQTTFFDIVSDDPGETPLIIFVRGTGVVQAIPDIQVTDSTQPTTDHILDFGTMGVNTEATETVRVTNAGTGPLVIGTTTVSNAIFVVKQNTCANTQVPAGGSCTIAFGFKPTTAIPYNGTLTISSNDGDTPSLAISLSGTGTDTPTPQIVLTDPIAPTYDLSVPFGQTTTGSSYNAVLNVRNNGNSSLTLYGISSPGAPFTVAAGSCASATIAPGESCAFTVYFKPTSDGLYTRTIDIQSNDPDSSPLTVSLSGDASSPTVPDIDVSDPVPPTNDLAIDMGSTLTGLKLTKGVTVRNLGTKSLQLGIIYATGANFGVESDLCSAAVLAPGAGCTFDVAYVPATITTDSGSVTIPSDDPDENPTVISLTGAGAATQYPDVFVTDPWAPSSDRMLDFGQVQTGESASLSIQVGNSGHASLIVNAVATTNVLAAPFSISADGCTGATVPPGGTCPITITYAPSTLAASSDGFNITTSDPDTQTITFNVSGQGAYSAIPVITVSDSSAPSTDLIVDFGVATAGDSVHATHTVTVGNQGSALLNLGTSTTSGAAFNVLSSTCNASLIVPIGSTCNIVVEFVPTQAGPQSGSLAIPSNDPDTPQVVLTLVGQGRSGAVPNISVTSPSSLNLGFGQLTSANLPASATITIANKGWSALNISAVSTPLAPFTVSSDTCNAAALASSATCTIGVSFAPAELGAYSGVITIDSDDPDEPEVSIALNGSYVSSSLVGNPPTAPVLVSPANGAVDVSIPATFTWESSTDPDGDAVTYELAYSTDPSMAGATVVIVASAASDTGYASAAGGAGMALIACAMVLGLSARRRLALALMALALVIAVAACGNGPDSSDTAGPTTPVTQVSYTAADLSSGTLYYWSVTAVDSSGNRTGSGAWSFTTAN